MKLEIRKAQKTRSKLRMGISGPSGSGKTYSALLMASGMTDWDKIVLIDTERGSGDLYSDLGEYNVITLEPPFTPEVYIEAIKTAEEAGMEVIIIDSVSHEWDGQGGCLEIYDQLGGRWQDWAKVTPRHNKFIQAIVASKCHIVTTARRKVDYTMVTENGKSKVEKLGMKEVQREGFEYELTLNLELNMNHLITPSKDRTGLFDNRPNFVMTPEIGKEIKAWSESGAEPRKTTRELIDESIVEIEAATKVEDLTVIKQKYSRIAREEEFLSAAFERYHQITDNSEEVGDPSQESEDDTGSQPKEPKELTPFQLQVEKIRKEGTEPEKLLMKKIISVGDINALSKIREGQTAKKSELIKQLIAHKEQQLTEGRVE